MSIIKVNFQTGKRIKDDPIEISHNKNNLPLFQRVDYKVSPNCINPDSYYCLCIKCGWCGRKFRKDGTLIKKRKPP